MVDRPDREQKPVLKNAIISLLFASEKPLSLEDLLQIFEAAHTIGDIDFEVRIEEIESAMEEIKGTVLPELGLMLGRASGGYRILTATQFAPLVGHLFPTRKSRFSPAALETIALVAYRQPCTRAEIEAVRGVDCGGMLRNLLERGLIRIVGQRDEPGRPLIYATSEEFLSIFSLDSLEELPPLRHIENLSTETNFKTELLKALPEGNEGSKVQLDFESMGDGPIENQD